VSADDPFDAGVLFRREAGRMTSALVRLFGPHNLPLAEDVVSDALVRALETWKVTGLPENPSAWLMAAAKHRAIDVLRREQRARAIAPDLAFAIESEADGERAIDDVFGDEALKDEQLRMMFACCHARLPEEARVVLMLNLLGGFGVREIAAAFLVGDAAMEKRLQRGKQVLSESPGLLEVTPARVEDGIGAVHRALYLLFNEGYHGNHPEETVRVELCAEAIRLATLLVESPATARPDSHALLALMCLSAARLPGRVDAGGDLVPLEAQDRSRWDAALVRRGVAAFEASANGDALTTYHLEAALAYSHATAPSYAATPWDRIVTLYDQLLAMAPSPVVALSRAIAIGELHGPARALAELEAIDDRERLERYPFYAAAIGEELARLGRAEDARTRFEEARGLARSPDEARFFERRIAALASTPK
jgi:RNA polymerase sigma-70 factor (ECF subfamily)